MSETTKKVNRAVVMLCGCAHDYQDHTYGRGRRVHNECKPKSPSSPPIARCVVCTTVREIRQ